MQDGYFATDACIDSCIHTFAGIQLRLDCAGRVERQGHEEPTGQAKIALGYNLPCDYVLHTVGPIIEGRVTPEEYIAYHPVPQQPGILGEDRKAQPLVFHELLCL